MSLRAIAYQQFSCLHKYFITLLYKVQYRLLAVLAEAVFIWCCGPLADIFGN